MESDFSGYVTKAGLRCTDGRTIMPDAFKHQHKAKVPLVWQHGHTDPENVLGHVLLENRDDGVYGYAFLNKSHKAKHAAELVDHRDINMFSIYANQLVETAKRVTHGAIKEVSLVLAGANPGALIDNVTIRHADGDLEILDDEAVIFTGIPIIHTETTNEEQNQMGEQTETEDDDLVHEDMPAGGSDKTVEDVYNSMNEEQKTVLHFMVGEALQAGAEEAGAAPVAPVKQSDAGNSEKITHSEEEGTVMANVFEQTEGSTPKRHILQHDDVKEIVQAAKRSGSLKHAVEEYALSHGIDDIDLMFPDAQLIEKTPEFLSRRMEWVAKVMGGARKSPFAKVRTHFADITEDEARAKGYITGELKREEFFAVMRRETTPQTIYKKQKLDRDDMIDITDFDVVAWLRAEMRVMLDEEVARAILLGDGRDISHEDKISESNIRPIASDHFLYATTVTINLNDASSNIQELIDAVINHRKSYKGSGLPTMFTSETVIAQFLLLKDTLGRQIYKTLSEVAEVMRVSEIVPVEAMDDDAELVAILVNMTDYVVGTDKGGEINMFDDFDIDYNQYKYLLETRLSGALARPKSAIVFRTSGETDELVAPTAPTYDDGEVTVTDVVGVVLTNGDGVEIDETDNPIAVAAGESYTVYANPDDGYYFSSTENTSWTFRNRG